jgi:hypothetical protein
MPDSICISQPWGGLGDNLAFSTLPELYSKLGYDVYISSSNAVRNSEIFDLVWGLNPFIKGKSDMPPNAGECKGYRTVTENCTQNMELCHNITEGYRKYPKIYYTPKLIPDLSNTILYDLMSINKVLDNTTYFNSFTRIFNMYPTLDVKKIHYTQITNRNLPDFQKESYTINTIYDLCDAIYSCKVFVCSFSGQSVLASAIKEDNEFPKLYALLIGDHTHNRAEYFGQMFQYPNATYI